MAQQNLIEITFTADEQTQIRGALTVLRDVLGPKLKTLSAADRRELPKMGDKTVSFVRKTLEYGEQNPVLVPAFVDLVMIRADLNGVEILREFAQVLRPLTTAVEDTMMLAGSEAYQGGLAIYRNIKAAVKSKVANAETIFKDLSARFPGTLKVKKTEPTE